MGDYEEIESLNKSESVISVKSHKTTLTSKTSKTKKSIKTKKSGKFPFKKLISDNSCISKAYFSVTKLNFEIIENLSNC